MRIRLRRLSGRRISGRKGIIIERTTRQPSRAKSEQVLNAAVELFLANGFDQTSMDAIAQRAGVSKTTVYAHYDDKIALFRAVMRRSARSLEVKLDASRSLKDPDPERRLTQILLTMLEATTAPEFLAFLRVMVSESVRHQDLHKVIENDGSLDPIGLMAETLEDDAARLGYRLPEPRRLATVLMRITVAGPQLDSLLFPGFHPGTELLEEHARWIANIFLRGIRPREHGADAAVPPITGYDYPWLPDTMS